MSPPRSHAAGKVARRPPPAVGQVLPKELQDLPPTLTVEQTARLIRIGRNAAYDAIAAGELPAIRIRSRWVVLTVPLLELLGVKVVDELAEVVFDRVERR